MNYEEIIERLLDEKHITAKEAVCLLDKCRETVKYQYFPEYPCQSCPYRRTIIWNGDRTNYPINEITYTCSTSNIH